MENKQDNNKVESQNQNQNYFPISIQNSIDMSQNPISILSNDLSQNEQTKNNFIQKRNRIDDSKLENIDKLQIDVEIENKNGEINDSSSDINMKSPHPQKNKLYQMNQINNHDQFICKKMSIDLDDDITNPNVANKKYMGCNCKNSGCLKRYCECFL